MIQNFIINTIINFFKKIKLKTAIIIITIILVLFGIYEYYNLLNKYHLVQIEKANIISNSDSLKILNNNINHKLITILSENDIKEKEIKELNKKIDGDVISLNKLKFGISTLEDSIKSMKLTNSIQINNNLYEYSYSNTFRNKDYILNTNIYVKSTEKPNDVDFNYKLDFNDIDITISTRKEDDYKYSILVKSNSDIFKLKNANGYINIPKPKIPDIDLEQLKPKILSFWNKFNFGIYGGIDLINENGYIGSDIIFNHKGQYSLGYKYRTNKIKELNLEYKWLLF